MYLVFIIRNIHHLLNESKIVIFAYNINRRVYLIILNYYIWKKNNI